MIRMMLMMLDDDDDDDDSKLIIRYVLSHNAYAMLTTYDNDNVLDCFAAIK